jgi:hypothetical protein
LILTCFPQRWKQEKKDKKDKKDEDEGNHEKHEKHEKDEKDEKGEKDEEEQDHFDVLSGVMEDIKHAEEQPLMKTVYDLALCILRRCSGVFDEDELDIHHHQFFDMFESSMGDLVSIPVLPSHSLKKEKTAKEPELVLRFNKASSEAMKFLNGGGKPDTETPFMNSLLNIEDELAMLAEVKDMKDELHMLSTVLDHQSSVLARLSDAIKGELKDSPDLLNPIRGKCEEQHLVIKGYLDNVQKMDTEAERLYHSVNWPNLWIFAELRLMTSR